MQNDLFTHPPTAPLAERLRPQTLAEVLGQEHLTGEGKPLSIALASGEPHSMILWGSAGIGKTTLARIVAQGFNAQFLPLSAVFSGVKDIREAIVKAQIAWQNGQRTILFVDEVHRFNKAQQDAFLPHVESGLITFIGATTENPSFEVNSALLSRAQVYTLNPLNPQALAQLSDKVFRLPENANTSLDTEAQQLIIQHADGDARRFLNTLEQILRAAHTQHIAQITSELVAQTLGSQLRRFDKGGEQFYNQISALHKSVRGSHPNAALYWFCRMLDSGADPRYLARRIVRMAWEDIGLADPRALQIANDAATTYERLGSPEGELALAQAVLYLASAAKSNAGYTAYNQMRQYVCAHSSEPVPVHLCNAPTKLMKELGYGRDYRYAHDEPNAYAAGETYMPDNLEEPNFYQPVPRGLEIKISEKLKWLKQLDDDVA
ncbi:replication-associated recombination protein A [Kingella negevensis]|uniref:replication-associated recombination protein A n=1 Tax=Kingella negevensis TaxID=1522312 RepID=UPI00254A772B|nr:replication-associated recombination protein A [Kingella negevensis]MDK4679691.1 replication-associated recombination protein A [Kingella negevensis]MDK4682590.1 replication-associated recombination protein A [Kingella negevensis]MDK4690787.1 replication-associated recombination protein A [Kingella negevensis]MDK4694065.1 replication-associated recombination protein A [Kingella negevensis]MDK4699794.1 replication-associated recombination protein A [Kingella negevensis]